MMIVNPKNDLILLWKNKSIANAFDLKINDQRAIGFLRIDRNGEVYWKFRKHETKNKKTLAAESPLNKENHERPINANFIEQS